MVSVPSQTTESATTVSNRISCYDCECYDDPNCACNNVVPMDVEISYCVIIRYNFENEDDFIINLGHVDQNSTRAYVSRYPYLVAEESILYNETTEQWHVRTNLLVYGCDWDLCNHPRLLPLLPGSFKMKLSDEWLNKNILHNGTSERDCHECPDAPQCGTTEFLDASRCPVKACNTTCVVSDLFDDPSIDELCYQSYCASPDSDEEENQHRVELEGIIYDDDPSFVDLWEIDLYCRGDDCSRPELFREIRQNITVETQNITLLFDNSSYPTIDPELICYDCQCEDNINCECETYTVSNIETSYCTIIRENYEDSFDVILGPINRNSTRLYIREFPYLLVEESILYNETTKIWWTRNNIAVYGCNWDYCNDPRLIPYLPSGFKMGLPDGWLNLNVLGTGQPVRDCHECLEAPQCGTTEFLDVSACPIKECNTTCVVSDTFDDPASGGLCYQSFCAPPNTEFFEIDPHRVDLDGIIYGSRPTNVELWEIGVFCRASNCSRPDLFKDVSIS